MHVVTPAGCHDAGRGPGMSRPDRAARPRHLQHLLAARRRLLDPHLCVLGRRVAGPGDARAPGVCRGAPSGVCRGASSCRFGVCGPDFFPSASRSGGGASNLFQPHPASLSIPDACGTYRMARTSTPWNGIRPGSVGWMEACCARGLSGTVKHRRGSGSRDDGAGDADRGLLELRRAPAALAPSGARNLLRCPRQHRAPGARDLLFFLFITLEPGVE